MGEIWGSNIETLSDSLVTIRNLEVEVRTLRTELRRIKAGVMVEGSWWGESYAWLGQEVGPDTLRVYNAPGADNGRYNVTVYIVPREVE